MRARELIVLCVATALVATALVGCGGGLRRFPLRATLWVDDDRQPFTPGPPEEREVPYFWDAMDHMVFRPMSEVWLLEPERPSINVNAMDEVPDSSWFVNRIGRGTMTPAEVAMGACGAIETEAPGPWVVTGGKPSGASPGFTIRDGAGTRHLLKTDRVGQPEQSTAADAIVAALFHAAGYYVPCNRVFFFEPDVLELGEGAEARRDDGSERPMTRADLDFVTQAAARAPDGRRRVVLSRFVEGRPVGPWDYVGTWDRDPNDIVPHERRRELRGSYVFDAWVDHWDSRQQNTLATWIETGPDAGYVRHYLLDFGETLGLAEGNHRFGPRMGHTAWLDVPDVLADIVTLGLVERPWDARRRAPVLAYFDAAHFDPERWHPQYWNGALEWRTEGDVAWAARILARFTQAQIEAAVRLGRYSDPALERGLIETLMARRAALLERYLGRLSPLADPELVHGPSGPTVCLTDLAAHAGIRAPADRRYEATLYRDHDLAPEPAATTADGDRVCVALPDVDGRGGPDDYAIVDVVASSAGHTAAGPARLHFYATGPAAATIVGLERPANSEPPSR